MEFKITPGAFEYLAVQRGGISDLRSNFDVWKKAYEASVNSDFLEMLPHLPERCSAFLDVGGGLSGIGVLLHHHYGKGCCAAVLDGKNELPAVVLHSKPFNNATVTQEFQRLNGVINKRFFAPKDEFDRDFELVISLQAWGFHFSPILYLERVDERMPQGAVAIIDVRDDRTDWYDYFADVWGEPVATIREARKWNRYVYIKGRRTRGVDSVATMDSAA